MSEPTGDCYQANGRYVFKAELARQAQGYTLVHGMVSGQGKLEGRRFGHAWVEIDDGPLIMVLDQSNGRNLLLPRDMYYRIGEVDPEECRRYTPEETLHQLARHHHWGPWEEPLIEVDPEAWSKAYRDRLEGEEHS